MSRTDTRTDGQTDGWTDGRTDNVKTAYPTTNKVCGGYNNKRHIEIINRLPVSSLDIACVSVTLSFFGGWLDEHELLISLLFSNFVKSYCFYFISTLILYLKLKVLLQFCPVCRKSICR